MSNRRLAPTEKQPESFALNVSRHAELFFLKTARPAVSRQGFPHAQEHLPNDHHRLDHEALLRTRRPDGSYGSHRSRAPLGLTGWPLPPERWEQEEGLEAVSNFSMIPARALPFSSGGSQTVLPRGQIGRRA